MFEEFRFGAPSSEKNGPRSEAPGPPEASRNQGSSGKRGRSEGDDGHPPLALGVPELLPPHPLRLIIIGHNPSAHAWRTGHYYSNPNNWMWRILRETGIAPETVRGAQDDRLMPALAGVGFADVGSGISGTRSAAFSSATLATWRLPFFLRLEAHVSAAAAACTGGCASCAAPRLVAFSGVRHFRELFPEKARCPALRAAAHKDGPPNQCDEEASSCPENGGLDGGATAPRRIRLTPRCPATIRPGRQWVLPAGWPLPPARCEVWVMPSTSGAAAMTREERVSPWRTLAARLQAEGPCAAVPGACACVST
uniref:Uracil-DNA glycosylase-like domain-containing protein n=2 Tax=Auxenochlorella protothecoides TaxID=3075 RepID=A0A1D2A3E7_AUXPR